MAISSLATMRVRRACADALDARATADELAAKVKAVGAGEAPRLRASAYDAWKAAQAAESVVRELSVRDILEAAGGRETATQGVQMTFDEIVDVVRRVAGGENCNAIAVELGRHPNTLYEHVKRWQAGVGRAARRAKKLGIWPSGRTV